MTQRILLVGAGAVGQVFAYHLQRGGADIAMYVRPKYVEECSKGFDLFELGVTHQPRGPLRLDDIEVFSSPDELDGQTFDQVWLCVSSTGLQGGWLDEFLSKIGDATLVSLQPGPTDAAFITARYPAERVIHGLIGFIAYAAPLPDERFPGEGMAFWLPPLSPSPMGSEEVEQARLDAVTKLLERGGLATKQDRQLANKSVFPTALLSPFLMALELEDWKLGRVRGSTWLTAASEATREACEVMSAQVGHPAPAVLASQRPWMLRGILGVAPKVMPLPLETYLEYHFTKVGDQTRATIATYLELANQHDVETPNLRALHDALVTR